VSNVEGMRTREKSLWWTQRRNANNLLENFVKDLEKQVSFKLQPRLLCKAYQPVQYPVLVILPRRIK